MLFCCFKPDAIATASPILVIYFAQGFIYGRSRMNTTSAVTSRFPDTFGLPIDTSNSCPKS